MVTATISEVKNGLSAYLRRVKAGETVLIIDRKTPIARIVPLTHRSEDSSRSGSDDEAHIERLVAEGIATRESGRGAIEVLDEIGDAWPAGHGLLDTLLDEREAEYRQGRR